jgi:UDP-N-acetylmuramate dehydrogenase
MEIKQNVSLKNYCSFFIGGPARYLLFAQNNEEIIEGLNFAKQENLECLVFGGGSNMLVSDNGFDGLALRVETIGMDIISETDSEVRLRIASGEVWDDVVRLACEENWWGIENLSHIPGFVGAFPVQNVGAYGQEASQVVEQVEVYDKEDSTIKFISNADCKFGYRSSIFNKEDKNRFVILSVDLKLSKIPQPNLSYGDLKKQFGDLESEQISIQDIRQFVIQIRDIKFPFPTSPEKGNSGSFFRGPILTETDFNNLLIKIEINFGEQQKECQIN